VFLRFLSYFHSKCSACNRAQRRILTKNSHSATAAGIIDGVGYLAGWLSGDTVARITVAFGWKNAFLSLAGVALATALVAMVLAAHQRFRRPVETEA
jgi:sugar phosphate permease